MIDLGRIERWAAGVEGELVAVSKDQLAELIAEIRAGRRAMQRAAVDDFCAGIARGGAA